MENIKSGPKTKKGKETKQRLMEAAEEVFGKYGYHQAGITDITKMAEVSLGTFYNYFESKKEIFSELVIGMQYQLRKEIKIRSSGITDRIQLEEIGYKTFFQILKEHKYMLRIFRQAEFVDESLHRNYYETLTSGYIKGMSNSVKNGEIRELDPEFLVYAFMGISDYIGMKWILWEDKDVDECIEQMMSLIKYGIKQ